MAPFAFKVAKKLPRELQRLVDEVSKIEGKLLRKEYSGATAKNALQEGLEWASNEVERLYRVFEGTASTAVKKPAKKATSKKNIKKIVKKAVKGNKNK